MFASSDLYQIAAGEYQRQPVILDTSSERTDSSFSTFSADAFKQAVFQRLFAITVPARSKDAVQTFVAKLQNVLEGILLQNQGGLWTDCLLNHFNLVGQYQKDVAIAGPRELYGEMVITLASIPTVSSVKSLGLKIVSDLVKNYPGEEYQYTFTENQLKVSSPHVFVSVHIAASPDFMFSPPELSPEQKDDAIPMEALEDSQRLLDESDWFAVNASTTSIKGLVRLISDLRERFPSFRILNDPAIDLLAHYCVTEFHEGVALSIEAAFRRFLEFISMGVLLRDAYPANDIFPVDVDATAKMATTKQAAELLCSVAQGDFSHVFDEKV